jgi:hypothetical protein
MFRAVPLFLILCLASPTFAQSPSSNVGSSPSPLQIVYVVDGSTLSTYNVDSQTLQPTLAGMTTLQESVYPSLTTSPNGRTLYYTAYQDYSQAGERLYVYNTNSSGVPGSHPIQTLTAKGDFFFQVNPTGKFLYLVHQGPIGSQYTLYFIVRFVIDPSTGKISQPVTEAKYKLDSYASGLYCSLVINGMSPAGTKLYDTISCSYPHGGTRETYYERTVDPTTGALGPDQPVYYWDNASGGGQIVQFVKNLVFDFVVPDNYQQGANFLDVYRLQPNIRNPLIHCTGSMLADCGSDNNILVHPSAQYVFMVTPSYTTNIDKVELNSKQIVATSSTIPYEVQRFSPDGKIAYAANDINTALNIQIYGFNVNTAQITAGGLINVPSDLDSWFAAERH